MIESHPCARCGDPVWRKARFCPVCAGPSPSICRARAAACADPLDGPSPPTAGHIKGNVVRGCACRYCTWRRAKKQRQKDRAAGVLLDIRPTEELRAEVLGFMGAERFERLEIAMGFPA